MELETEDTILGELEDQVTCWICFEVFDDPVTLTCNHSFCRACCLKMYKKNPLCAFCRREFTIPLSATNQELLSLAQAFRRKQRGEPEPSPITSNIDQNSFWLEMPDEIYVDIFQWLEANDLGRTSLVCQEFNRLAEDNFLWREKCLARFPFVQVSSYGNSWKRCYISRHSIQRGWETGKPGDFKVQTLRGHQNYISTFDYYRNNVVSGSADNTIKIWSVNKRQALHSLTGHTDTINAVRFNEVRIVSGSKDHNIKVWDTSDGQCTHTLAHGGEVNCVEFNEQKIISAGANNQVKVWDLRSGQIQHTLGHQRAINHLEHSGNRIISCGTDAIKVWDIRTGACLRNLVAGTPTCFRAVPGSREVVTAESDGTVRVWDLGSSANTFTFQGGWRYQVNDISCQGDTAVVACSDNKLRVYNIKQGNLVKELSDHAAPVFSVQFDGHRAVSGSADNALKVWDVKAGKRLYSLLGGSLQARSNNPPHPQRPGCSFMKFDEGRIVASFNSLLRVYSFTGEAVEK